MNDPYLIELFPGTIVNLRQAVSIRMSNEMLMVKMGEGAKNCFGITDGAQEMYDRIKKLCLPTDTVKSEGKDSCIGRSSGRLGCDRKLTPGLAGKIGAP